MRFGETFESIDKSFNPEYNASMKKVSILVGLLALLGANLAFAATPTLSVMSASGQYFQINVTGDANYPVTLYYYPTNSSSLSSSVLGNTTSSGTFTTTVAPTSYNIPSGSSVYVIVNGQQSPSVVWPYYSGTGGNVTLSQTNINISQGQSQSIYISGGSGSYYISSNSNPSIASATINGSNVTVYGNSYGSDTITICSSGGSGCASLYVYVSSNYGGGYSGTITASQSNVSLNYGQSTTVYLSGGTGIYYVSTNSNSNVVSTSINGNILTLQGQGNGSSNLSICSSVSTNSNYYTYNSCVPIYVNVGTGYYGSYTGYNGGYTGYYNPYTYPTYSNYPRTGVNVSGVLLSNIPYTGIAENLKMTIFVLGLMIWSGFLAYLYLTKRHLLLGTSVPVSMGDKVAEFKKLNLLRKQARN